MIQGGHTVQMCVRVVSLIRCDVVVCDNNRGTRPPPAPVYLVVVGFHLLLERECNVVTSSHYLWYHVVKTIPANPRGNHSFV